jgi:transposase InsO family protein
MVLYASYVCLLHSHFIENHLIDLEAVYPYVLWWFYHNTDSLVHCCERCQFFARQKYVPSHHLQTIPITWPFSTWGLDLVGPFKKAKGGFTHIFVAVDKFTKWFEVKSATSITTAKTVEFIREIMYRFGVPNNIITDNGTKFTVREFKDFCADSGITINPTLVSHPQSNSQAEQSNVMILQGLKARFFDRLKPYTGKWVKELLSVLLGALCTTLSRATCHMPSSLFYGSEAMLPTEVEKNRFEYNSFLKNSRMTPESMI